MDHRQADSFHIPRWEELPAVDLYMEQVITLIHSNLGAFFEQVGIQPITKNMINKETLAMMKPTAILINTARGALVVEEDLYEACKNGVITAAGLDAIRQEPVDPKNPLLTLDNVIIYPHIGGNTAEAAHRASYFSAMGIQEVYEGKKPTWPINNIDYTITVNGLYLGDATAVTTAMGYEKVSPELIVTANAAAKADGRIVTTYHCGAIEAEQEYGTRLPEFRDSLLNKAVTASVDDFDAVYDQGMDDYLTNGGQEIIDERAAKLEQYYGYTAE